MIDNVRMALEFGNTMVVVVAVDATSVHARVTENRALPGIRPHDVARNTVVNRRSALLPASTVREVVSSLVLVDVRSFKHLAGRQVVHLHVRTVAHRSILRIVQLDNVKVVRIRTAIAFATAPRHVSRAVVINKDTRVKAPGNAIATDDAATTDKLILALAHSVCPRTFNRRRLDVANAAATAIREHNIERAVVDSNARSPNVVNAIYFAGIVNNAVVCPVLHIPTAECIKGVNLVAIGIVRSRVIGVGDDVEIIIICGSAGVGQVVIGRNRVVSESAYSKARHQSKHRCFLKQFHEHSLGLTIHRQPIWF